MTAVLFPDVETLLVSALPPLLAAHGYSGVKVHTRVPNPRVGTFVRILAGGGTRTNLVADSPTVTIESWAPTEPEAADLARITRACLELLRGRVVNGTTVYGADFPAARNLPDPDSSHIRYTATGSLRLRGVSFT